MSGKEHFVIGTSASIVVGLCLLVNREINNILSLGILFLGGAVGSVIPDIDTNSSIASKIFIKIVFILLAATMLYLTFPSVADVVNIKVSPAIILFFLITIISKFTKHRSFTHKISGILIYCYSVYLFNNKYLFLGFTIGYILHILCDFVPNKKRKRRK